MRLSRVILGVLTTAALTAPVHAQTKIVCVGDSITQGNTRYNSYRRALWQKLTGAGYSVDFVGSLAQNDGGPPPNPDFDVNHEGHWGWRADAIRDYLPGWMAGYVADVALLHIGTNDAIQNDGGANFVNQTVSDIEGIIWDLRANNPKISIVLANLLPAEDRTDPIDPLWNSRINALNAQIDGIANRNRTEVSKIVVVDQNSGFNVSTDTVEGLHPNAIGEAKMAAKWFDALTQSGLVGTGTPTGGGPGTIVNSAFLNGSFESGLAGWTVSGNAGPQPATAPYQASDGATLFAFNSGQRVPNGVLSQTFATTPGQLYTLMFDEGVLAYNRDEQRLHVTVAGNSTLLDQSISIIGAGNGATKWAAQNFQFTADKSATTLIFKDVSLATLNLDLLLDKVRVVPGPIPAPPPALPPIGQPINLSFESDLTGWTASGNVFVGISTASYLATDGTKLLVFNRGQSVPNGVIAQRFSTTPGQAYRVAFDMGVLAFNQSEQRLQVVVQGNSTLASATLAMSGSGNGLSKWKTQSIDFVADDLATTLTFRDVSLTSSNLDLLLDNVHVVPQSIVVVQSQPRAHLVATSNRALSTGGVRVASGSQMIVSNAAPGAWYRIEHSADLKSWNTLGRAQADPSGSFDVALAGTDPGSRFYRVALEN